MRNSTKDRIKRPPKSNTYNNNNNNRKTLFYINTWPRMTPFEATIMSMPSDQIICDVNNQVLIFVFFLFFLLFLTRAFPFIIFLGFLYTFLILNRNILK
ncbi:hypothetical protein YC2023_027457 [Brassica napus]